MLALVWNQVYRGLYHLVFWVCPRLFVHLHNWRDRKPVKEKKWAHRFGSNEFRRNSSRQLYYFTQMHKDEMGGKKLLAVFSTPPSGLRGQ